MKAKMPAAKKDIPSFNLDSRYLLVHKEDRADTKFGMDNTYELIEGGFGLYSSALGRATIGPLKSQFYRIGFCREGSLDVDCGLETFSHQKHTIHFNFPGQLFGLRNRSADMHAYYILFTQEFIDAVLPARKIQQTYPFLDYAGVPFFQLSKSEAKKVEELFLCIDEEIRQDQNDKALAIKLLVELILLTTKRSYIRQGLNIVHHNAKTSSLVARYKKMVGQHFIKTRSVAAYASKLALSAKHLSKVIKEETGKNASDFIDEMLMMEIKALLRHSDLSIAEIAYQLDFTDPSHLTKFFKKQAALTPLEFRRQLV
jgi:AraC family transcriptional regulator, transcriptional activator of pobA